MRHLYLRPPKRMERGFGLQLLRVETMADCRDGATPFERKFGQ